MMARRTAGKALGRSRGGFTTKIHLPCNAEGLAIGAVLSEGEAHDVTAYDELMEQRDSDPGAMLADKGYDSDAIRQDLRDRGAAPAIPAKRNRTVQYLVNKSLYALRSRIVASCRRADPGVGARRGSRQSDHGASAPLMAGPSA
jgi:IS5 family transposase